MSEREGRSDLFLVYAGVIIVSVALYFFQPIRVKVDGFHAVLVSYQVFLFDRELSKDLKAAGRLLLRSTPTSRRQVDFDKVESYLSPRYQKAKKYSFIIVVPLIVIMIILAYLPSRDTPSMATKRFILSEVIKDKYDLVVDVKKEGVVDVKRKLDEAKKKKNIPLNVVARLYPKGSSERLVVYKGNSGFKIEEVEG